MLAPLSKCYVNIKYIKRVWALKKTCKYTGFAAEIRVPGNIFFFFFTITNNLTHPLEIITIIEVFCQSPDSVQVCHSKVIVLIAIT